MIEIAALFVATISALSSVIQAAKAARDLSIDDVSAADNIVRDSNTDNPSAIALAATGIDDEYIEIATNNIERALDRFKGVWRDPSLAQAAKDQELDAADFVICSELRRITRLNGGVLPGSDRFHDLWRDHGCT